ncbi:MAG: TrkH family potassium uptake protein [Verrucomicrobiota bacterium]|nr:TrkH family potassium uptake protein [Verrucomicrobiota bacterium]MEE2733808.1 TrkH family potassium uptake protein [Verrucomicrobiota bacterium]
MNFRLMAKVFGWLFTLESVAMVACGVFAYYDPVDPHGAGVMPLMIAGGITFLTGIILLVSGRSTLDRIPRREGVLIVGLGWVLSACFGAIPFLLGEPRLAPTAALFESVSGFTTTGSTVIADLSEWPRGILLWRAVMQWLGGLGILVLFVALLSSIGGGAKSLFRNESSFQSGEATTARIQDTALLFLKIYLSLTAVCLLGLRGLGLSWFDAVAHAFTTVATGGFSPHNNSIAHFSDLANGLFIEIWLELFMILGSTSFLIYLMIVKRNWQRLRRLEEVRWYFFLVVMGILGMWVVGSWGGGMSAGESLRGAAFTIVSIASTTGYSTVDYGQWPVAVYFILLVLMLVGGCAGSTSGGMKVSRLILLLRAAWQEIVKAFRPNQILRMQVNGNPIDDVFRAQTVLFVALFALIALVSMVVVAVIETAHGIDFDTTVSSVLATFGNIGPGYGEVGPAGNYGDLYPTTQVLLSLLMVLGRLELYVVLVLFVPTVWKKY